jgi:hypothetical protein
MNPEAIDLSYIRRPFKARSSGSYVSVARADLAVGHPEGKELASLQIKAETNSLAGKCRKIWDFILPGRQARAIPADRNEFLI